ncbi:unnamed protein product [Lampetra planeri]
MDQAGYDLLVLEQLLALAHELDVVLPATEEDDLSSLRIARCIQAHIHQKRRAGMLACAAPTGMLDTRKDNEPAQAWASVNDTSWRAVQVLESRMVVILPGVRLRKQFDKGRVSSVPEELGKASAEVVPQGNSVPPKKPKRLTSSPDESTTDAQHGADRP